MNSDQVIISSSDSDFRCQKLVMNFQIRTRQQLRILLVNLIKVSRPCGCDIQVMIATHSDSNRLLINK